MPEHNRFVRIDLNKDAPAGRVRIGSQAVSGAMIETANVPISDKFRIDLGRELAERTRAHGGGGPWARLPDGDRAAGTAVLFEVALVVLLGPVKRRRRTDLRDDLPPYRFLLGVA
jgi:hypothetical protein